MPQYELNLRDYWRIIKKKKVIVITTVILLGTFSFIFALMNKPEPIYQAVASLKIERASSLAGLYDYYWSGGNDLATRAEEIKSYPIIEKAAQVMGLIDSSISSEEIRSDPRYFSIVLNLRNKVKTQQEGYTNIINIITTSHDPREARDLANALAKVYIKESFKERNKQITQALETIKTQLDKARKAMQESQRKVREYREKHRFVTLDNAASRLTTELEKTEKELENIRNDIKQIDNLLASIETNPEYIYVSSIKIMLTHSNPTLSSLQSELNRLRTKFQTYSLYYTKEHPVMKDLKAQIKETESRFIEELKAFRDALQNNEKIVYEKWKKLDEEYRALPLHALTLANLERELEVNTKIYEDLELKYQEALIRKSEMVQEVYLLRPAFLPHNPINPAMIGPTTAVGIVIGLILGIILAFVAETLDTTFSTIDDIEKSLDTTVLGVIPHVDIEENVRKLESQIATPVPRDILEMQARIISHYNPKSTMAEAFRSLRTNVHFGLMDKGYKTISITSSVASEGKTTIAANLAVSMAQIGLNTLLVEADLRKPKIYKIFGIDREPGLTDIVLKRTSLDEAIKTMTDLMTGTMATDIMSEESIPGIEYLNILTAGKAERNPSEILASRLMDELIDELKQRYDIIIFDTTPIIQATDAPILSSKVDSTIIVYYQGKVSRGTLRRAKSQLDMLKADILGVIINGMRADISADYSDYKYSYEYYYSYGTEEKKTKNKVIAYLERQFLKPPSAGPEESILKRLRKLKIAGLLTVFSSILLMGALVLNHLKSGQQQTSSKQNKITTASTQTRVTTQKDTIQSGKIPETEELTQQPGRITSPPSSEKKPGIPEKPGESASSYQTQTPETRKQEITQITVTKPEESQKFNIPPTKYTQESKLTLNGSLQILNRIVSTENPYVLVINSFSTKKEAMQFLNSLKSKQIEAYLVPNFKIAGFEKYLICIGNFSTPQEAKGLAPKLMFLGIEGKFIPIKLPYSILLGTFQSLPEAKRYLKSLPSKDYAFIIAKTDMTGNPLKYETYIGRFKDRKYAEVFAMSITPYLSLNLIE